MIYLVALLVYLLIFAGLIVLQIYLSRMESPWPGRILPILSFLVTLAIVIGIPVLTVNPNPQETISDTNGTEITDAGEPESTVFVAMAIPAMLMVFVLGNIPTLIYIVIYRGERQKFRKKKQMEKMNIQDLE